MQCWWWWQQWWQRWWQWCSIGSGGSSGGGGSGGNGAAAAASGHSGGRIKKEHTWGCCGGSSGAGGGNGAAAAAAAAAGQSGGRIKKEHTWGSRCVAPRALTAAAICWCDGGHGGDMANEKVTTGCDVTYQQTKKKLKKLKTNTCMGIMHALHMNAPAHLYVLNK